LTTKSVKAQLKNNHLQLGPFTTEVRSANTGLEGGKENNLMSTKRERGC